MQHSTVTASASPARPRGRPARVTAVLALAVGSLSAMSSDAITRSEGVAATMAGVTAAAEVAATEPLERFVAETASFRADFEQTLYDADSEPLQSARGTVVLARPGRFVWDYSDGVEQTIVADGERVWLYDRELEQVTVNALADQVGGTPLALLAGEAPLEEAYTVGALGASEGVEWFELLPKGGSGDFEALYVGLDEAGGLAALELRDAFGQATQILFTGFEAGIDVDEATFRFEVPEGVDVIGLDEE